MDLNKDKKNIEDSLLSMGKMRDILFEKYNQALAVPSVSERREFKSNKILKEDLLGIKAVEKLSDGSIKIYFENETDQKNYFDTYFT